MKTIRYPLMVGVPLMAFAVLIAGCESIFNPSCVEGTWMEQASRITLIIEQGWGDTLTVTMTWKGKSAVLTGTVDGDSFEVSGPTPPGARKTPGESLTISGSCENDVLKARHTYESGGGGWHPHTYTRVGRTGRAKVHQLSPSSAAGDSSEEKEFRSFAMPEHPALSD